MRNFDFRVLDIMMWNCIRIITSDCANFFRWNSSNDN